MNKNNNRNKGFSKLSFIMIVVFLAVVLVLVSCSGSDKKGSEEKSEPTSEVKSVISDSSMNFSGKIAQTTCLDCHPKLKDGGFDIDFTKVKEAGMVRGKNMDIDKEDKKESEK